MRRAASFWVSRAWDGWWTIRHPSPTTRSSCTETGRRRTVMRLMTAHRLARRLLIGASLTGIIVLTSVPAAQTLSARETTHSGRRALEPLPYYGVFDFMAFGIDRGTVTLTGYTYNGSLRYAAEAAAKRTSGVDEVSNRLELLPASQQAARLRWGHFFRTSPR